MVVKQRFSESVKRWLKETAVLTFTGSLLYCGLKYFLTGLLGSWWDIFYALLAIAAIMGGIAVLLVSDEYFGEPGDKLEEGENKVGKRKSIRWAELAYLLLVKRTPLMGVLIIGVLGVVFISYYVFRSIFPVEFQGESGTFVVRLPGQTVYYRPIDPYGWQNTGVQLKERQTFKTEISGRVSVGHLRFNAKRELYSDLPDDVVKELEKKLKLRPPPPWDLIPFRDANGYLPDDYVKANHYFDKPPNYRDPNMTVEGLPYNVVVGIIVHKGEDACNKPTDTDFDAEPCTSINNKPAYTKDDIGKSLYNLSWEKEQKARRSGDLWVTINDSDLVRWDNSGFFILRITTP